MYTNMSTFPMTSEQLRAITPNSSKSYKKFVKYVADKISELVVESAKKNFTIDNSYSTIIDHPTHGRFTRSVKIEGMDMRDFQYTQYSSDVMTELQRNFPTSKVTMVDDRSSLITVKIDWSQDFMNPTEMFSD
jgi:predicted secreted protein